MEGRAVGETIHVSLSAAYLQQSHSSLPDGGRCMDVGMLIVCICYFNYVNILSQPLMANVEGKQFLQVSNKSLLKSVIGHLNLYRICVLLEGYCHPSICIK